MPTRTPPPAPDFEPPLHVIRGFRVILDADLARLYGVPTKRLNEAVRRNSDRFPSDFAFQLIPEEIEALNRTSTATGNQPGWIPGDRSQATGPDENVEISSNSRTNWPQIAASSQKHRAPRLLTWAFTEHGALMAGTVLRSPRAVQMSLYLVRAFMKLRQIVLENENLSRRMTEAELALRAHDEILADIYDKLEPLLEPEPAPTPKRKFGFETTG